MILPQSTDNSLSFDESNTKYNVWYFNFHGLGACPRALLCLGDAQWENKIQTMEEWPQVKDTTSFGILPILLETNIQTTETIKVPESGAIERYLANKFGFMDDTLRDQILSDSFYAQAEMLTPKFIEKCVWTYENTRKESLEQLLMTTLPSWMTLGDIKTAAIMDTFLALDIEHVLSPTLSPGLWKLETVDTHPAYSAWRKSKAYKTMDRENEAGIKTMFSFDLKKSHIFS
ncbi:hypothetical protein BGZ50_009000 [Haplosporangium sp. Z 11]|nr:hypothetical protein BGZ50_009000 [Haplosporangium sp. Z 11]